jgi:hypothetical protein
MGRGPGQVGALETVQQHGVGRQQLGRGVRERCRCRATASGSGVAVETRWGARSSAAGCGTKQRGEAVGMALIGGAGNTVRPIRFFKPN